MKPKFDPKRITYAGETHSIREWAKRTGIPALRIYSRLCMGWRPDLALTRPCAGMDPAFLPEIVFPSVDTKPAPKPRNPRPPAKRYLFQGAHRTVREIAKLVGLDPEVLRGRLNRGHALEVAILPKLPLRTRAPMPALDTSKRKSWASAHFFEGEYLTLAQIAERTGVNLHSLKTRLRQGLPLEEAAKPERRKRRTIPKSDASPARSA